LWSAPTH